MAGSDRPVLLGVGLRTWAVPDPHPNASGLRIPRWSGWLLCHGMGGHIRVEYSGGLGVLLTGYWFTLTLARAICLELTYVYAQWPLFYCLRCENITFILRSARRYPSAGPLCRHPRPNGRNSPEPGFTNSCPDIGRPNVGSASPLEARSSRLTLGAARCDLRGARASRRRYASVAEDGPFVALRRSYASVPTRSPLSGCSRCWA